MQSEFGTKPGVDVTGYRHTFIFGAGRVSVMNVQHSIDLLTFGLFRGFALGSRWLMYSE
jgi:hypothetical protein